MLLSCFSTDLDEIHNEKKDFFVLFKMAPSAISYLFPFRNDILTKLGVKLKSLSKFTQTSANFGRSLLGCSLTDLHEIHDEMKDFFSVL